MSLSHISIHVKTPRAYTCETCDPSEGERSLPCAWALGPRPPALVAVIANTGAWMRSSTSRVLGFFLVSQLMMENMCRRF